MDRSDSEAFFSKHYRKISAIRNYMSSQLILKIERYDPEIFILHQSKIYERLKVNKPFFLEIAALGIFHG